MPATDLTLITHAIRTAGRIATSYVESGAQSWEKPGNAGPVTEADLAVNSYLETVLRLARPDYGWLSEETEDNGDRLLRDTVFIIDPIDGTRSFVEGSKTWAHSIAVAHQGTITAGAIFLPRRGLLYTAARGQGAMLNGAPLVTTKASNLETAEVLAAKPILSPDHWPNGVPGFDRAYRPSLAYRMGLVGQGRFDAMLTFRPTWEWDVAAGALIVEEAQGACSDKTGAALRFNNPEPLLNGVVASGQPLHARLIDALGR
ncbi:3'(2'),5'-bisphosphate nucleotidase CysQ [Roseobacter weihaiensis]|uniref:3'(2'),5'-bisphosphate nucleotidase CysQ n=1 Tax=Roseobacter weihaiensis TaxID=2763262 RepID=UPI001D0A7676|nr:3'(2'),5'-bisphosphate nucleotidase CysQ [Roseobacter sp. H9]